MSRLDYLNQMVQNNLENADDPCAENAFSIYKAPCIEDLTDSSMTCLKCCMNTEDSWGAVLKELEHAYD